MRIGAARRSARSAWRGRQLGCTGGERRAYAAGAMSALARAWLRCWRLAQGWRARTGDSASARTPAGSAGSAGLRLGLRPGQGAVPKSPIPPAGATWPLPLPVPTAGRAVQDGPRDANAGTAEGEGGVFCLLSSGVGYKQYQRRA